MFSQISWVFPKYFTVIVFLSYIRDITDMLIAAYDEGMFENGEYAFITIDTNANEEALVNIRDFLFFRFTLIEIDVMMVEVTPKRWCKTTVTSSSSLKIHSHVTPAFAFFFAVPFLKTQILSVNTITCYHRTRSRHLTGTQTQTLLVNNTLENIVAYKWHLKNHRTYGVIWVKKSLSKAKRSLAYCTSCLLIPFTERKRTYWSTDQTEVMSLSLAMALQNVRLEVLCHIIQYYFHKTHYVY